MADILAQDALVPKTEWEQTLDRALPVLRVGKHDPDMNKPHYLKGKIGPSQRLSEVPEGERTKEEMLATQAAQAQAKAKAEEDAPYRGTPMEKRAYQEAKAKAARGQKLTHADRKILYKFNVAVILAKARRRA